MKLKKFDEYSKIFSTDSKTFESKVIFACSENYGVPVFKLIFNNNENISENDTPIILWNNFKITPVNLNERLNLVFNLKTIPSYEEVCTKFKDSKFIPVTVSERSAVKKLKFPIIGVSESDSELFKTYGKFKKSEKTFPKFREKITPRTRFDVISFKNTPIHIQETVNALGFDVNLNTFKYSDQVKSIVETIQSEYPLDFYHISLIEANDTLYLESISTSAKLSPSQNVKMYECAYENYYESCLPNWFKGQLFEKYVAPYYKKRGLDSLLVKPKHSIDFEKYIK